MSRVLTRARKKAINQGIKRMAGIATAAVVEQGVKAGVKRGIEAITRNTPTPVRRLFARKSPKTPRLGMPRRIKRWGMSTARYRGRFKKPTRRNYEKKDGTALKFGYHITKETFGTVTDPHCAYISHSTMDYLNIPRVMAGAILRKLFRKAGLTVNSSDETLPLYNPYRSGKPGDNVFELQFVRQSPLQGGGLAGIIHYVIGQDENFQSVLENSFLKQAIFNYINRDPAWPVDHEEQISRVYLYMFTGEEVAPEDTGKRLVAQLDLSNEVIHLNFKSELKVQNRTKGDAAGASAETDRVDNTPLTGQLYQFRGGHPALKSQPMNQNSNAINVGFNVMDRSGVTLTRSGTVGLAQYREPPNRSHFKNCVASSKVLLQPGDIKNCSVSFSMKGKFDTIINKLRAQNVDTDTSAIPLINYVLRGIPGKSQTLCLEEIIRSITSNDINLVYERQWTCGAYLITKNNYVAMNTELQVETKNNIGT